LVSDKEEESTSIIQNDTEKLKDIVDESSLSEVTTQVETNDVKKTPFRMVIDIFFDFVKTD